jgi:type IV secretory pathway TraG/TraD family ATPase VirD4
MLDEFGTIGKLNAVAQAYGLMAGLGMIMWAFSQDLNQLKRDYPRPLGDVHRQFAGGDVLRRHG